MSLKEFGLFPRGWRREQKGEFRPFRQGLCSWIGAHRSYALGPRYGLICEEFHKS